MSYNTYQNPLCSRYSSKKMQELFSPAAKFRLWRQLWVALAEAQNALGLPVALSQIEEMRSQMDNIPFERAEQLEKELQHDVMAHILAYGEQCPHAKPIIHWGATSCFVTDNADIILFREALALLENKLNRVIEHLAHFAEKHADLPCLAYTHFQPAQLTTVGKRACLWVQDFFLDLKEIKQRRNSLKLLGAKGATGTQASFYSLLEHDHEKVKELDQSIAKKMGFDSTFPITGQTYPRKVDMQILSVLTGIAASAHKFATDLRLLSHLREIEEPFQEKQVGSSAMPYKRNPILAERICGVARYLISLNENPAYTASTQWLERTLDDSSNRRIVLPEAFLACDALLLLLEHITAHLVLYSDVIHRHVQEELPFIATENILMAAVNKGGDRQQLHEKLGILCKSVMDRIKCEGAKNDLLDQILKEPAFNMTPQELSEILNVSHFIGRAPQQVREFLSNEIWPELTVGN